MVIPLPSSSRPADRQDTGATNPRKRQKRNLLFQVCKDLNQSCLTVHPGSNKQWVMTPPDFFRRPARPLSLKRTFFCPRYSVKFL